MLEVGTTNEKRWIIKESHLASAFGSGLVDVLATPVLVGFCEETCRSMVDPHLPEGQKTVGTSVSLDHTAATPLGMAVRIRATLMAIEGRKLAFEVSCEDDLEPIGRCSHTRFIINTSRFEARIAEKGARAESGD
jgi:fluoroacetyl-CoA thioesterase